ncbi:2-hydroxychromene-2-carboxylate isomerase [Agrobacterium tumefaciens]|jgi:2-hydroxychromene-2-carboxylate isomerase|uniref:2-hydroxychromene-2-carboxylate isomerase n=1 Tax=Agrobacterium TaxID=357 RepID=UPI000B404FF0|nr:MULTISPECIES: DsbA family protein [Agrobacterium]MBP2510727.1 2-hydroxychromene-2-carboxylate isomerase [Agrobacterium tumefaciens]MBP2520074.1 2-hydroxychromene-2-carboxylate isomerase [Agrobacterium tumefaciens]MBP2578744.1 2-hydroxychromene-2-carboxylate isomerase [Agrobacterium tumefaciens]MBP2597037.1 2-hydroxychromene-2-carboxylate isomerase [Agrobacterium tumefaciens]MDR6590274.1 2-hydroxychromene-2-carboxylate isomerase [Agrobacterium tumefaciens]
MTKTIDYFFSIGSPWAFIGLEPFAVLAKEQGATIRPHVIPLIEENGGIYSRNRPEARRAYWIRDLKRWAALRGKVLNFDNRAALSDPAPAGLMVAAAIETGDDWLKLAAALQEAFWVRGEDIGNADVRRAIATAAGFDAAALDKHGQSDAVAALQKASFEAAREAGVFGVPTYRYQDELYWGQDSLPFLERHLRGEKLAA